MDFKNDKIKSYCFVFLAFLVLLIPAKISFCQSIDNDFKIITESSAIYSGNIISFRASVWTSEGISIPVKRWIEYRIIGDSKVYKTPELEMKSNSSFFEKIPFNPSKTYCFIPYAYKIDEKTKERISDTNSGIEYCFPKLPSVKTLQPGEYKASSAFLRGEIIDFAGLKSVYTFFLRSDEKINKYQNIGGQIIYDSANSNKATFGWYFNDFNTEKNGKHCYQACATDNPLNVKTKYNCGEKICFPKDEISEDYFKVAKKVEALKAPDCQKAKITIDISCKGTVTEKERSNLDVIFLIDKSGTMSGQAWESTKHAAKNFIDKLNAEYDRAAIVSFSRYARYENDFGLTDNFDEVKTAIDNMKVDEVTSKPPYPATNLGDGLKKTNNLFTSKPREEAKKIVILLTDGIINAGQSFTEVESVCPSYPVIDNICTKYAISQAINLKNDQQATIYTIRYSDPKIDSAHSGAAKFSKLLLTQIAKPKDLMVALTPDAIEQKFGEIVFSFTQHTEKNIICNDVNVTDILPEKVKYINTLSSVKPKIEGQKLIYHFDKIENGTRKIELIVKFPDAKEQFSNIYPDSKVEFTDYLDNKQSYPLPETKIKDLIECSDVDLVVDKIAIPYRTNKNCQKAEVQLKIKCIPKNPEIIDPDEKLFCKDIIINDFLPEGVMYSQTPYLAIPNYDILQENNPNQGETAISWKLGDMIIKSTKIVRFNVSFETDQKNQLVDIFPDSSVQAKNMKGELIKKEFPETRVDPYQCPKEFYFCNKNYDGRNTHKCEITNIYKTIEECESNPPANSWDGKCYPLDQAAQCDKNCCGPIDIAFALDVTGSMGNVKINAIRESVMENIVNSKRDYRLGLVTFEDWVTVRENFSKNNFYSFDNILENIKIGNGAGDPEASDEALNTIINALAEREGQEGSFAPGFEENDKVDKMAILITDAPPGGFDDFYSSSDTINALKVARQAKDKNIKISAINYNLDDIQEMQSYARITGGIYKKTAGIGSFKDALDTIIYKCEYISKTNSLSNIKSIYKTISAPKILSFDSNPKEIKLTGSFQDQATKYFFKVFLEKEKSQNRYIKLFADKTGKFFEKTLNNVFADNGYCSRAGIEYQGKEIYSDNIICR